MKRNTRQDILTAAKALFNQRGFNAVSTRDIAQAIGISKGNLTYYFKKKEEIVEAVLLEQTGGPPTSVPSTLEELDDFFLDIQKTVEENAFYFWHHAQFSQISEEIRAKQFQVYRGNVEKLTQTFHTLGADGTLREESFPREYDRIIDTLLLTSIYWMPFCQLKQEDPSQWRFRRQAWSVLFPLLTESGRAALELILRRKEA